jgi:hypothetical protein
MNVDDIVKFPKFDFPALSCYETTKGIDKGNGVTEYLAQFSFNSIDIYNNDNTRRIGGIHCGTFLEFSVYDNNSEEYRRIVIDFRDMWYTVCGVLGIDPEKITGEETIVGEIKRIKSDLGIIRDEDDESDDYTTPADDDFEEEDEDEDEEDDDYSSLIEEEMPEMIDPPVDADLVIVVPPTKSIEKEIRLGIVVDHLGSMSETPEEQITEIQNYFASLLDIGVSKLVSGYNLDQVIEKNERVDVLVIDYGGVATTVGFDGWRVAKDEIEMACRYAENHPGTLLVLWTYYTREVYEQELSENFAHVDNIIAHYSKDYENLADNKIRAWVGLDKIS